MNRRSTSSRVSRSAIFRIARNNRLVSVCVVVVLVALVGTVYLVGSRAAGPFIAAEPESGSLTGNASKITDSTASASAAVKFSASSTSSNWPDATNTGTVGCPALEKVNNGDSMMLQTNGQVLENKEFMNNIIVNVKANNVTIRCVKWHGTGWFGIDNTMTPGNNPATNLTIDRVDMDCKKSPQIVGMLIKNATVTRTNTHDCDHFANVVGDNVILRDNYCHDLTDAEVVHADCVQIPGGATNILIEHNAFWSRDTSDILIGSEDNIMNDRVVINDNRLMSMGSPPPAFLLYVNGTNTVITNNRFTKRHTYGACTLRTPHPVVWSGNVWDETGEPFGIEECEVHL